MTASTNRHDSAIRKGKAKSLPFKIAIVGWIDLLGYGDMIADAGYNPLSKAAAKPIRRLREFHGIVAEHSQNAFRTLVINDGAVAYRDLSFRGPGATVDFLCQCWALYSAIRDAEARSGSYGARMVVAAGLRAKGSRRLIDRTAGHLEAVLERLKSGAITPEQAVHEAAGMERVSDLIPQLQANFAFTKAYVAEQSGKRAGLPGPGFYAEDTLFRDGAVPPWISADTKVDWSLPKYQLSAGFIPITALDRPKGPSNMVPGLRDAIAIGTSLAPTSSVAEMIHALFKQELHPDA